ncbi:MAG: PEP-CTERM sorting domain-containing protein [Desulfomicrobium sp.]|nr:PEP-CTERM sorting domain-containing protein [Desulfomicrobium sp.]
MRKLILGFILIFCLSANAYAIPMYWDLSQINYALNSQTGPTDLYIEKDLTIRNNGTRYPYTQIVTDLGADGILSDNDTFIEGGILGIVGSDGDGYNFWDTNKNKRGYIYYEFLDISGYLDNVVFDITTNTFKFDILFDKIGEINLKYTTDATFQTFDGVLATYSILDAGTTKDGFTLNTGVGQGSGTFGFDLLVETIETPDFWFLGPGYDPAESFLATYGIFGYSTLTATLIKLDTTTLANDNKWILTVQNVGTMEHAVPEPSTMLLLGAGLLGLGAVARRRKN